MERFQPEELKAAIDAVPEEHKAEFNAYYAIFSNILAMAKNPQIAMMAYCLIGASIQNKIVEAGLDA